MRTKELNEKERESIRRVLELVDIECEGKAQTFADKAGIAKASVSHYRHYLHAPSQDHAYLIGKAFNVNPMWVMGFDVPKRHAPDPIDRLADITIKVVEDIPLTEALLVYFNLPDDKKKHVLDTIYLLGRS